MGNTYCCQQYYYTLPCTPQSKKYVLSHKIQKSLSSSKFRDVCKRTIQRYFDESLQLEQEQNLRRSTASFSHYESNNLNNSILEQQTQKMIGGVKNHFPQKSQKPNSDREKYLLRLIRQSYLFLDLSDCLDNRKSYDRFIKHELIKDPSLDSFITNEKASVIAHLEMELKNFNQSLIQKLQNYVRFCRKVKHDFTPDNQRFLSKLNLNLQSQIIQKYLNKDLRREPNELLLMLEDVNEVLRILMMIVEEMYNLNIEKNSQQAGSISEDEFFCPFNLFTMIASIVFDSSEFSDFIIDKIKQCFKQSFTKFKNENTYTTSQFVSDFIALNSNNFRRQSRESNISLLYTNNNYSSLNIFVKTKRLIQKLFDKSVPLYKLKIIYQIYQQMSKEQQQLKNILYEKYNVDLNSVFNRQGDLLVVKWLLKENRQRIDTIASHILFTYYFIHSIHRSDIKGSSIVTYIDQIQRIINHQWNSPN